MPRTPRINTNAFPYHVRARCINKDWFRLPIEQVWDIFSNQLFFLYRGFQIDIHAFVLMSNHYHMIVSTPKSNLSDGMLYFTTNVSRQITNDSCRINQTFGGPYKASLLTSPQYYMHAYKYVYRNPVEAGLSDSVLTYPYSSLNRLMGLNTLPFPIKRDDVLFSNVEDTLKWLDTKYRDQDKEIIRKALRRKVFTLPIDRESRKPHYLENKRS
ncbi:MAG: transposase [Bdellovibrionales bacterium]